MCDEEKINGSLALFRDNPISLRRFSIFTTSFELAADFVADGHSKYSRNLVFTLAARGKPDGEGRKDARRGKWRMRKDSSRQATTDDRSAANYDPII